MDPAQKAGLKFMLANPFSGLFHKPGLGKTRTTLELFEKIPEELPALVLAPKACVEFVWPTEVQRWTPHRKVIQVIGSPEEREHRLYGEKADYYVVGYDNLDWLVEVMIKHRKLPARSLIFDEASKMKTHNSVRFKQAQRIVHNFKRRHLLTGTPAPNGYLQLWSLTWLLDRGKAFGDNWYAFRARYFHPIDYKAFRWVPFDRKVIEEKISHLFHVRETYDLPDLVELIIECKLGTPDLYHEMRKKGVLTKQELRTKNAAIKQSKLRQLSNGFYYDAAGVGHRVHTQKFDRLAALMEELEDSPVMILYEFKEDLAVLRKYFPKAVVFSEDKSLKVVSDWNSGKIKILLLQPQSAGHGLNLQGASNTMVWVGPPFDLEIYQQTVGRLHRRGQKADQVFVYFICSVGSIDTYVFEVLRDKDSTQDSLMKALRRHEEER